MEDKYGMRYYELFEAAKNTSLVEWPTNLTWRIQLKRYANVDALTDIRRNKLFAMPFRNWVSTYWHLTGKDWKKLKYMPTQVIEIPDDAIVGDMATIDSVFFMREPGGEMNKDAQMALDAYTDGAVSYATFKNDPWMFSQPEIMIEPSQVKFLSGRVVTTARSDPDEAIPTPLLGIRQ